MKNWLLITVLVLAAILRFWRLDSYPALNADEAAIGYNAYSLIQTGNDEHGNPWPIHFQSFNDYKPGLYFYLVLPFVKILGLNEWAVRLPGATLGVLTVLVVYFLVKELFRKDNLTFSIKHLALSASLLLAISPWHIHFSRGGWEVNVATFLIAAGVLFFLKGLKSPRLFTFSFLLFALSLYTYHSARIVVPLLLLGLSIIYLKEVWGRLKEFIVAGAIGVVFLIPLANDLLGPAGISRAAGVGLFADSGPLNRINEQRGEHESFNSLVPRILHNKVVNYGLAFVQNWAVHFHGEFLFLSGDAIQRNKVPETGQMYLFEIVTILAGILAMVKMVKWPNGYEAPRSYDRGIFSAQLHSKSGSAGFEKLSSTGLRPRFSAFADKFVFWWLIVAPAASALTFQSPHALRSHNMVIPLTIIGAYGLYEIVKWLNGHMANKKLLLTSYFLLLTLVAWQFARYQHMYWVHMAKEYLFSSQYGVSEMVGYVSANQEKYERIIITDRYDQPYILFLFYSRYSPKRFQEGHVLTSRDKFGFSTVSSYDKYEFRTVKYEEDRDLPKGTLLVGTDEEIPEDAKIVKEIHGSNGYKYFQIVGK